MGFTVVGQATDAMEAFEMICNDKPDVIFTDIRMPEISGIELLKLSRRHGIESEFVIVSGFSEFEYAQEALRFGAFDFQLKPLDPEFTQPLLQRLSRHLDRKRKVKDAELLKSLSDEFQCPLGTLKEHDFIPCGPYWQVIALKGRLDPGTYESLFPYDRMTQLTMTLDEQKAFFLINGSESLESDALAALSKWSRPMGVHIGMSRVTADSAQLSRLIREADMAGSQHFVHGMDGITRFDATRIPKIVNVVIALEKLIVIRNYQELCKLLDSLPELFRTEGLGMYHVTNLWNQFVLMINKRVEAGPDSAKFEFLDYDEILKRFETLTDMLEHLKGLLERVCHLSEDGTVRMNRLNSNFIALLEHVTANYEKELSLRELAERYFLNVSYCSALFRKVTGYTFSEYVTKLRMEAAAELLHSKKYTAEKVSLKTGYNDYYYFCKVFKKFYGVSPSQFTGGHLQISHPKDKNIS